jgi:hypothetical protein
MSARMVELSSPLFKSIKPSLEKKEKLVILRKVDEQRLIGKSKLTYFLQ